MGEEYRKWEERESEAIRTFYQTHTGWHLSEVSKCPAPSCSKSLYCEEHKYAYRKWWVNLTIGVKPSRKVGEKNSKS